jgi:hypothetical protein
MAVPVRSSTWVVPAELAAETVRSEVEKEKQARVSPAVWRRQQKSLALVTAVVAARMIRRR